MSSQQLEQLKKKLHLAEAELRMRERNRNASEKGYRRVAKHVEDLRKRLGDEGKTVTGAEGVART